MKTSPTQRSLAKLRRDDWIVSVVERWNPHAMIRQDLYGFADLLAHKPGVGILAVQSCAGASLAARRDKLLAEPRVRSWLLAGGLVVIHAWRKIGPRGKRKTWQCLEEPFAVHNGIVISSDETRPIEDVGPLWRLWPALQAQRGA